MFKYFVIIFIYYRVIKQALRASGANATPKHIKEVSLSAFFLMEAAKKADNQFGVTPQATAHTVRDANKDIAKMASYLTDKEVTVIKPERTSPSFVDPIETGMKRLTTSWLEGVLSNTLPDDDLQRESREGEVDLDFELHL